MLTAVHLGKDWQEKVKTWFNQPGRKHRRRIARQRKARLIAPNPTHKLRPIVRGMTNKYNNKIRLGRGFTTEELKKAGINSMPYAKSLGIAIDLRRKDTSAETQTLNVNRIKEYLAKMILYPRKKADKKAMSKCFSRCGWGMLALIGTTLAISFGLSFVMIIFELLKEYADHLQKFQCDLFLACHSCFHARLLRP
jgi:ribosomal protein L13E